MPSLGADMEAATLVKWRVEPGQAIRRGDIIAEVETEKGIIDIECFQSGVVETLDVAPGTKVPVGARMATIRADGGAGDAPSPVPAAAPPPASPALPVPPAPPRDAPAPVAAPAPAASGEPAAAPPPAPAPVPRPAAAPERKARVSPLARARAAAKGIDLTAVHGTGPGGAIQAADVERALSAPSPAAAAPASPGTPGGAAPDVGLAPMRRAIAAAMAKSKREIPHYYLQTRIDMHRALQWLQAENQRRSLAERVLPAVVLFKATARALRDVPALNGHWVDGAHRVADHVHLGFAIALKGGGLVAPAVHDVDTKSCRDLMAELHELIPRARSGRLRSSEMTDATLTVTNLGDLGVESVNGVIYPPQVALVGFGRILEQPWAVQSMVGVRPIVTASLAADHRATDGHIGARFLDALDRHLQHPEQL